MMETMFIGVCSVGTFFFFSSRRRHTRCSRDWSSDVCSSDLFWFEDGRRYQARQSIEVGNADLEGVNLAIMSGITIPGRIVWDGKPSLERDEQIGRASCRERV